MPDAGGHRPALEITRHQRGVEMQRVVEEQETLAAAGARHGEFPGARHLGGQHVTIDRLRLAELSRLDPEMLKRGAEQRHAMLGEWVEELRTFAGPAFEPDGQLESAGRAPDEVRLVDPEVLQEFADVRHGGLAHTDRADLGRFDQRDLRVPVRREAFDERRRGHPAGGPTANDHHGLDAMVSHASITSMTRKAGQPKLPCQWEATWGTPRRTRTWPARPRRSPARTDSSRAERSATARIAPAFPRSGSSPAGTPGSGR